MSELYRIVNPCTTTELLGKFKNESIAPLKAYQPANFALIKFIDSARFRYFSTGLSDSMLFTIEVGSYYPF